jgi:hypothetical protein
MEKVTEEKARQRVHAKCRLTSSQYNGCVLQSPADVVKISEVLTEVFGDYTFDPPHGSTAMWGFVSWAKWIHGGW